MALTFTLRQADLTELVLIYMYSTAKGSLKVISSSCDYSRLCITNLADYGLIHFLGPDFVFSMVANIYVFIFVTVETAVTIQA